MNTRFETGPHPEGRGTSVKIDGHEVSDAITGYSISHSGNNIPNVNLYMELDTNAHYDPAKVELALTNTQVELLTIFGWKKEPK